jgi:iron complex transport system substrate-binding protein
VSGTETRAAELVGQLRERLAGVSAAVAGLPAPRALVLEWTEPPFAPGHWVPEMVERAGAVSTLGSVGAKSFRTTWEAVAESHPGVIVSAPCGFALPESRRLAGELVESGVLPDGIPLWAVDANASFARPGPRLVDGVETLAAIVHPDADGLPAIGPESAVRVR